MIQTHINNRHVLILVALVESPYSSLFLSTYQLKDQVISPIPVLDSLISTFNRSTQFNLSILPRFLDWIPWLRIQGRRPGTIPHQPLVLGDRGDSTAVDVHVLRLCIGQWLEPWTNVGWLGREVWIYINVCVCACVHICIPTVIYCYILLYTFIYCYMLLYTVIYCYILLYTAISRYTFIYLFRQLYIYIVLYIYTHEDLHVHGLYMKHNFTSTYMFSPLYVESFVYPVLFPHTSTRKQDIRNNLRLNFENAISNSIGNLRKITPLAGPCYMFGVPFPSFQSFFRQEPHPGLDAGQCALTWQKLSRLAGFLGDGCAAS